MINLSTTLHEFTNYINVIRTFRNHINNYLRSLQESKTNVQQNFNLKCVQFQRRFQKLRSQPNDVENNILYNGKIYYKGRDVYILVPIITTAVILYYADIMQIVI